MKNEFLRATACALSVCALLTGCDPEPAEKDKQGEGSQNEKTVYVLNEGGYQANNSDITAYHPDSKSRTDDLYLTANGQRLGDTAQDILVDGDDLYVCVYGSSYVARLDRSGKEIVRHAFTAADGQPRYMTKVDGDLFVTLYSGQLVRLDAATLEPKGYTTVGANPEDVILYGGNLYVANSGWGNDSTVTVVRPADGSVTATLSVAVNPQQFVQQAGQLFLFAYGPYDENWNCPYPVQHIDIDGTATTVAYAARGTAMGWDKLLMVNTVTDWSTYATTNQFFTYDVVTGTLSQQSPLQDAPTELLTQNIYMLEGDPTTGDVYVGITDFVSLGTVYRFSATGRLLDTFTAGVNPSHIAVE